MRSFTSTEQALITDSIELESGQRVVLLDVAGRRDMATDDVNRNIYCIAPSGQIIWQAGADGTIQGHDSFVSLRQHGDGSITARRFFGNEFLLDPASGELTHTEWSK